MVIINNELYGYIYAIKSNSTNKIYFGATLNPINKRFSNHRSAYYRWINNKTKEYTSSFEVMQYQDAYIELVETWTWTKEKDYSWFWERETYYINKTANCCNKLKQKKKIKKMIFNKLT